MGFNKSKVPEVGTGMLIFKIVDTSDLKLLAFPNSEALFVLAPF
jgi:hypothetical protein